MYCQSCQTKLSPRDQSCPTCGRRVSGSRDLGAGSSNEDSKSFPLPPARAVDDDSMSDSRSGRKAPAPPPRPAEARPERRKAERRKRPSPSPPPSAGAGFGLRPEEVLRLLADQPSLIEPGLEPYRDDSGQSIGVGFATSVGPIDLLARDDSGAWVVIAVADPNGGKEIVSDLLQRMGWVRRHLGQSGEEVRGLVLLDEMPDDLGYAAAAVSDSVEFKLYQLELTFEAVIL